MNDKPLQPTAPSAQEQESWTAQATASVPTERAARYGKQLITHMSRKTGGGWNADTNTGELLNFFGNGCLQATATDTTLELVIRAAPDHVAKIEEVVGVHLARFGHKDQMQVQWQRGDSAGSTQGPFSEEDMQRMAEARAARKTAQPEQ